MGEKIIPKTLSSSFAPQGGGGGSSDIDASQIISGVIEVARLPQQVFERLKVVADEAAMLALTIADVQNGDTVENDDTKIMYFVVDDSSLGTMDAFRLYKAGAAASVDWGTVTGALADQTDLQAALDGKLDTDLFDMCPTLAEAEALTPTEPSIIYCPELNTFYKYLVLGSAYTINDKSILTTGNGGDTRWIGIAGVHIYSSNVLVVAKDAAPYSSIQAAINDAVDGQVVEVKPGTYVEDVVLKSGVTLLGECTRSTIMEGKLTYSGSGSASVAYLQTRSTNKECLEMTGTGEINLVKCALIATYTNGTGQTYNTAKAVIKHSNGSIYVRNQTVLSAVSSGDSSSEHNTAIYWMLGSNKLYLESFGARHTVVNTADNYQNLEFLFCTNNNAASEVKIKAGFGNITGKVHNENYVAPFYIFGGNVKAIIDGNLMVLKNSGHCYCTFNYNSNSTVFFTHNTILPENISDKYLANGMGSGSNVTYAYSNYWDDVIAPKVGGNVFYDVHLRGWGKSSPVPFVKTSSANYSLLSTSPDAPISLELAGDQTVTIPLNSSQAMVVGQKITIQGYGTGVKTIEAVAGVTLNGVDAGDFVLDSQYSSCELLCYATNTWIITGGVN